MCFTVILCIATGMHQLFNNNYKFIGVGSCTSLSPDEVHNLVFTFTRDTGIRQEDLDDKRLKVND